MATRVAAWSTWRTVGGRAAPGCPAPSGAHARRTRSPRPHLRSSPVSGQPGERSGPVTRRAGAERGPRELASGEGAPEGEALDWHAQRPTLTPRGWGDAISAHRGPQGV